MARLRLVDDDDSGIAPCPHCGADMYEDAIRCPKCGDYVTPGAQSKSRLPAWIWVGLVLVGLGMLGGFVMMVLYG